MAVKVALRQLVRELIWYYLKSHKPGEKKNIALFGSRRSGTTLVMEVLAANKGITFSNQPLSIFSASSHQLRWLPVHKAGQLFNPDADEKESLSAYLQAIMDGSLRINEPWRFWRRDFDFFSDRVILKFTNAHGIADWITSEFDLDVIALFRHPIPQSLSVIRNNWQLQGKGFLENEAYRTAYLSESQIGRAYDILQHGSVLDRYVLDWCLENLPLLRACAHRPDWYFLTFEEFVSRPGEIIEEWARRFLLPDIAGMQRASMRKSLAVSGLSTDANRKAIESADGEAVLSNWKSQVDQETEWSAMSILELFEIDLYKAGSSLPSLNRRPAASDCN